MYIDLSVNQSWFADIDVNDYILLLTKAEICILLV